MTHRSGTRVSDLTLDRIPAWESWFGGHYTNPAEHALKTLQEAVELALHSGATPRQVHDVVLNESANQVAKPDFRFGQYEKDKVHEEIADLAICVEKHRNSEGMDLERTVDKKIDVLFTREWEVTPGGVLVRKGRSIL